MQTLHDERSKEIDRAFSKSQEKFTKHFKGIFLNDLAENSCYYTKSHPGQ